MEKELLINSNTKENYLVYWLKKLLPIFSLIILLFYFILAHLKMNIEIGDFAYFYEQAKTQNIFQFLLKRYNEWSSRIFIEFVMICVLRCPLIIFHILDIIVWISLFICLVYLIFPKEKYYLSIFVALLIIIYPLYDMETAGFFATLTNYIWPLSALLISFIPVKKSLNGGRVSLFENIISIIFLIYACSSEQCVVIAILVYLFYLAYLIYKKQPKKYCISMLVLSFILLLIIMIAPGNSKRKIAEISYYYEKFLNYNLVQKIFLCFNQFSFFYLNKRMSFFIVILLFALVIYNISKNSKWYVYFSIGLYFVGYFILINTNLFNIELIKNNITTLSGKTFIQFIASLFLILGLLFIIYLSFRKNKSLESLIGIISIPFIGICTKLIMVFSPTVFASSTRTSLFLYFSIIILIGVVIKETNLKNSNSFILLKFVFSIIISLFAIYGIIINFSLFC